MSLFGTKSVKLTLFHTTVIALFCIWHLQEQHKTPPTAMLAVGIGA